MPNTARIERLDGLRAIRHRIHDQHAMLFQVGPSAAVPPREIALAEAMGLVEQDREELVFCLVVISA